MAVTHENGAQRVAIGPGRERYLACNENLMVVGAMTDPKGDRSKGPADQYDPDQYVRVVERREDGVVIRGAKLHMTGAVNSHEILVMPTSAMDDRSRDYAVVFATPVDAPGITMIFGRQASDDRRDKKERIDTGKPSFGAVGGEAVIVFEDVFVPHERVFMDGETELTGAEAYMIYGAGVAKLIEKAGGRRVYAGAVTGLMVGEVEELWDVVALVEYPSSDAFQQMVESPEYQEIHVHRDAGLEGQLNIRIQGPGEPA